MKAMRIAAAVATIAILAATAIALLTGSMDRGIGITGFAVKGAEADALFPQDRIAESQIRAGGEAVVVRIANATIGRIEGTNSMGPLLGKNSTAIMILPQKSSDIAKGDIIAYHSEEAGGLVVHRVTAVGSDEQGWFAVTKGDNSRNNDPEKVRFEQIRYVIVGILY
ncbi:hypothetical protein HYY73_01460 [Candidatus Woesearchaeota archaeon]|nr:hypothetical protein [Candidatus Woesearchaeota archaeon]